jgi:hypothetical protein
MTSIINPSEPTQVNSDLLTSIEDLSLQEASQEQEASQGETQDYNAIFEDVKGHFVRIIAHRDAIWNMTDLSRYYNVIGGDIASMDDEKFEEMLTHETFVDAAKLLEDLRILSTEDLFVEIRQLCLDLLQRYKEETTRFFTTVSNIIRHVSDSKSKILLKTCELPVSFFTETFGGVSVIAYMMKHQKNYFLDHCMELYGSLDSLKGYVEEHIASSCNIEALDFFLRQQKEGEKIFKDEIVLYVTMNYISETSCRMIRSLCRAGYSVDRCYGNAWTVPRYPLIEALKNDSLFEETLAHSVHGRGTTIIGDLNKTFGDPSPFGRTFAGKYTDPIPTYLPRGKTLLGIVATEKHKYLEVLLSKDFEINTEANVLSVISPGLTKRSLDLLIAKGFDMNFKTFMGTPLQIAEFYRTKRVHEDLYQLVLNATKTN